MKYIVMECHLSYAVVLAEDGRFLNVANMHYKVGQTVTNIIEMQPPQIQALPEKKINRRWIYSMATIAACLVLILTGIFRFNTLPYASVYMTINPEVRIDVNRKETVIGIEGINEDGKDLIADYDYKKKDLDLVMDELVDLAIEMGYLHEGGEITLTFDAEDDEWIITRGDAIGTHLDEYVTEKMEVTIQITNEAIQHYEVIVPIDPTGSTSNNNYGESDYGDAATESTPTITPSSGNSNYGDSSYEEVPDDDGQSNYDTDDSFDNGQSNYDAPSADSSDDGQSSYDTSSDDDASNYEIDDEN